ncbi:proline iminopeptidase-family hydrolase [Mesorhizobium sp. CO1-1-8]|uniref:proline iminopeptidase-family hydrolase n=1 Tax=Mesorhizobium sp. CO1-1-8 TaxID=2876631 RepID=UPI001CD1527E|nr:proline iminopeptidase-family hydrolase [Mesorhizobium sp. CO1-1-8]MBZ9774949.1 proline iminopeptidase-family hydrolase [Mesorhizobium sp. CO1-1-8]
MSSEIIGMEGRAAFGPYETWYRVRGELGGKKAPVVILHGGPGVAHNYVDAYKLLARRDRAVIHYDQLGCGNSTLLPEKGADFWTPGLFIDELENLVDHLGIRAGFHVLGQSWGGMLGAEYAVTRPQGLKSLTIANSPASMKLWVEEANRLRADLPADVQETLTRHEQAGTTDDAAYQAATMVFYERHVCRVVPFPPEVTESFAQVVRNPTVYHLMNGPNEFHVIGTLKNWSIVERLPAIDVPTLIISGRHDEATPGTVQPYKDGIKGSRWEIFEHSSHMPHVEEQDACMRVVGDFLDHNDN